MGPTISIEMLMPGYCVIHKLKKILDKIEKYNNLIM